MSKIAINNEIVLMRQAVRRSRVSVVRKLIKESKLLQARKHGDEKVLEKCKRKARRLLEEVTAVKKIKDDEISKFGITETRSLQEILSDMKSEPNTRVMARLASDKFLRDRIVEFKEKFPDCKDHLGPGRKKMSKLQRKANRDARNAAKANSETSEETQCEITKKEHNEGEEIENEDDGDEDESSEDESSGSETNEKSDEPTENESNNDLKPGSILRIEKTKPRPEKKKKEVDPEPESSDEIQEDEKSEEPLQNQSQDEPEPGSLLRIKKPKQKAEKKKKEVDQEPESSDEIPEDEMSLEPSQNECKDESLPGSLLRIKKPKQKPEKRKKGVDSEPEGEPEKSKKHKKVKSGNKVPIESKKSIPIKVISKEATVKRFKDLIEDKESEEIVQDSGENPTKSSVQVEKRIDSFFMTGNGNSEYMSVVVPRPKQFENEDQQDSRFSQNHAADRRKNFHEKNNKFFSKIDQRSNNGYQSGGRSTNKWNNNSADGKSNGKRWNNDNSGSTEKFSGLKNGKPVFDKKNGKPAFDNKPEVKQEELHPSWAARKKQQEILKQGFAGKKIVFDD